MRYLFRTLLALAFVITSSAQAAVISIDPGSITAGVGDTVILSVNIADLVAGGPPSVGAFDLDVSYNASVLSLTGSSFGTGLDVLGLGSVQTADTSAPGLANFFEVSLDSIADLNALQPGAFALLTLTFQAIGGGASPIGLVLNSLADATGAALAASVTGGVVTVNAVPLPSTAWLVLAAIAGLAVARRSYAA
jgi:hypothetical protein